MVKNIGEKIKELRIEKGMKLAELGLRINISTSHLSQIENNKTLPSLVTLSDIARALEVELRHFFESQPEEAFIHRAARAKPLASHEKKTDWVPLTPSSGDKFLEVWMVTIQPNTLKHPIAKFNGEYFCYLISGRLIIYTSDELIELKPDDSIHFDGLQDSSWENPCDVPSVLICSQAASITNHQGIFSTNLIHVNEG